MKTRRPTYGLETRPRRLAGSSSPARPTSFVTEMPRCIREAETLSDCVWCEAPPLWRRTALPSRGHGGRRGGVSSCEDVFWKCSCRAWFLRYGPALVAVKSQSADARNVAASFARLPLPRVQRWRLARTSNSSLWNAARYRECLPSFRLTRPPDEMRSSRPRDCWSIAESQRNSRTPWKVRHAVAAFPKSAMHTE